MTTRAITRVSVLFGLAMVAAVALGCHLGRRVADRIATDAILADRGLR